VYITFINSFNTIISKYRNYAKCSFQHLLKKVFVNANLYLSNLNCSTFFHTTVSVMCYIVSIQNTY
jgi:hypothetical protein